MRGQRIQQLNHSVQQLPYRQAPGIYAALLGGAEHH